MMGAKVAKAHALRKKAELFLEAQKVVKSRIALAVDSGKTSITLWDTDYPAIVGHHETLIEWLTSPPLGYKASTDRPSFYPDSARIMIDWSEPADGDPAGHNEQGPYR